MEILPKNNLANYKMLIIARESRGLSQTDLANDVGVSQGNLSKIEQGIYPFGEELLSKVANVLKYPKEFFFEKIEKLPINQQFHRKRKVIQKKYLSELDSNLTIRRLHIKKLLNSIEIEDQIPKLNIQDYGSPEEIANKLRLHWKIPSGPIDNLVELLEDHGLIIVYTENYEKLDGMAIPDEENIPIIYLNKNKPPDRQRFTLAHELGHIVMHSDYIPMLDDDVEKEADHFASEFLMPTSEFKTLILGRRMNIYDLAEFKRYWKASMASILYKLNHYNLITPQKYRSLNVEMSRLGYKKNEPRMGVTIQEPTLLSEIIEFHVKELNYTRGQLANILRLQEEELISLYLKSKLSVIKDN